MIIVMVVMFVIGFELSVGNVGFVHAQETTIDSVLGFTNMQIGVWLCISTLITPILIENTGVRGTFIFYGSYSIVFLLYVIVFLRDTTYNKDGTKLTEKQKKQLYMPEEFKS